MIRDTSAQDRALSPSVTRRVVRLAWIAVPIALVVAGVLGVRSWLGGDRSVDADRVRIAAVRRGTFIRDIAADARVTAANSPTLYAATAGTIDLNVTPGDSVTQGQVVATIDSPELRSKLAQENATREQLQAELERFGLRVAQARAKAQSLVDQAKIDHQTAKRELEKATEGFEFGGVAEIAMLRAKDELAKADILLAHSRENLGLEKKGLVFERRSTTLQLRRQEEVVRELGRQVEALAIRSPANGVVGQVAVAQRAKVAVHDPLLTVVDLSALELEIHVPESFARELAIAMPTEINVRGTQVAGRVRSVSPEVVSGEVSARIEFVGETPSGLRQNQRLSSRIVIDERPDVLLIDRGPSVASSGTTAYFVRGSVAERRSIRFGATGLSTVEILGGANVGDRIVISGADAFDDTPRVRLAGD